MLSLLVLPLVGPWVSMYWVVVPGATRTQKPHPLLLSFVLQGEPGPPGDPGLTVGVTYCGIRILFMSVLLSSKNQRPRASSNLDPWASQTLNHQPKDINRMDLGLPTHMYQMSSLSSCGSKQLEQGLSQELLTVCEICSSSWVALSGFSGRGST